VTRVAYEVANRGVTLVVDLAAAAAGWRIAGREVVVGDVLDAAPHDEIERVVRRALLEIRGHATTVRAPSSERLRALASEVWRDFVAAAHHRDEQPTLPGM
jgi:hypothetical protein